MPTAHEATLSSSIAETLTNLPLGTYVNAATEPENTKNLIRTISPLKPLDPVYYQNR